MDNLTLEENTVGIDYIVGDIHGAFRKLDECLSILEFNKESDRLICVGDLVDRGPQSEDCINWLDVPWFYTVKGNHECLSIDAYKTKDYDLHYQNGGGWFYGLQKDQQRLYVDAFNNLPYTIEIPCKGKKYGIIHAECGADWDLTKQYLHELYQPAIDRALWSRTRITKGDKSFVKGIDLVIVGHTIVDNPVMLGNVLYIDTCGWHESGKFTFYNLQENKLYNI